MSVRGWRHHVSRLVLGVSLVLLGGLLTGQWLVLLGIAITAYLGWLLYNIWRLHEWLHGGAKAVPESLGMWAEIFDQINTLQQRNARQRADYETVIRDFQSMTNAFPDATLVTDSDHQITWFNDAARDLLGLKAPEDLGQPVTNLIRDPDFANWISVEQHVLGPLEMNSPRDDNKRLSASAVRFHDDQKLIILRDISEVHQLEMVRRDFVANVSHELRTPLTVLVGYLESLQEDSNKALRPVIIRMQEQAHQMQSMLDDLLELSRLQTDEQAGEESLIDVEAMLMLLKEQAEELSQGNHQLTFEVEPDLQLRGMATDIESAFRNLITNAIHYTPSGGSIRICWRKEPTGASLAVIDSGIGIPQRDIPRLTERFYRVGSDRSRHSGGTGLGLAIVKHVLNAHGARLRIKSELGTGSSFICQFPAERCARRVSKRTSKTSSPAA